MSAASLSAMFATSLPKKSARRFGDAVNGERAALAEVDVVQVQLEDLVLRRTPLEDERHQALAHLAACSDRSPAVSSALNSSDRKNIRASCWVMVLYPTRRGLSPKTFARAAATMRNRIDARVRIEALVFDREHRLLHALGDRRERHAAAASRARRSSSAPSAAAGRAAPTSARRSPTTRCGWMPRLPRVDANGTPADELDSLPPARRMSASRSLRSTANSPGCLRLARCA